MSINASEVQQALTVPLQGVQQGQEYWSSYAQHQQQLASERQQQELANQYKMADLLKEGVKYTPTGTPADALLQKGADEKLQSLAQDYATNPNMSPLDAQLKLANYTQQQQALGQRALQLNKTIDSISKDAAANLMYDEPATNMYLSNKLYHNPDGTLNTNLTHTPEEIKAILHSDDAMSTLLNQNAIKKGVVTDMKSLYSDMPTTLHGHDEQNRPFDTRISAPSFMTVGLGEDGRTPTYGIRQGEPIPVNVGQHSEPSGGVYGGVVGDRIMKQDVVNFPSAHPADIATMQLSPSFQGAVMLQANMIGNKKAPNGRPYKDLMTRDQLLSNAQYEVLNQVKGTVAPKVEAPNYDQWKMTQQANDSAAKDRHTRFTEGISLKRLGIAEQNANTRSSATKKMSANDNNYEYFRNVIHINSEGTGVTKDEEQLLKGLHKSVNTDYNAVQFDLTPLYEQNNKPLKDHNGYQVHMELMPSGGNINGHAITKPMIHVTYFNKGKVVVKESKLVPYAEFNEYPMRTVGNHFKQSNEKLGRSMPASDPTPVIENEN